jgi:hypothetical protein
MRTLGLLALIGSLIVGAAAGAHAQGAPAFEKKIVVSAGVGAAAGYAVGDRTAELRRNGTAAAGPFTLFRTESRLESAPGFDARVAYALSRAFSVEVAGTFSRPTLAVRITQDSEGVAETRSSESIDQYTVEFSGLFHLRGRTFGGAVRPYVIGGGGYLRQLHEDRYLLETGRLGYAGGGVHYWLPGRSGKQRTMGIRGEACVVVRSRGIDFEDKNRVYPRLSALGFIAF